MKFKRYWTYNKCKEESLKYTKESDFRKNSKSAYYASRRNGWLEDFCSNMTRVRLYGYWIYERCKSESLKYKNKLNFNINSSLAYNVSLKNKWLDEFFPNTKKVKSRGYWTYEKCQNEALKYETRNKFRINSTSAYNVSLKNKWLDKFFPNTKKIKSRGYWTYEKCQDEALKYETKKDFDINSPSAHSAAYERGWLDSICSHMLKLGSLYKRCVYVWEFEDHSAYIGITYNYNKRISEHETINKDPVYIHLKKFIGLCKQLTDYLPIDIIGKLENDYIEIYRKNGWIILNKIKGGGLGGNIKKWTYEKCKDESLKYKTQKDFKINSSSAYRVILDHKWYELMNHLINNLQKPNGYWTYERCKEAALGCKTRNDFKLKNPSAYDKALKNKWFKDICNHMIEIIKPKGYWTYEKCKEAALECKSKKEFKKKYGGANDVIHKNKWFELSHQKDKTKYY